MRDSGPERDRQGVAYAIAAYGFWGLVPLYWHQVTFVAPAELIAHRILWSLAAFALLVARAGKVAEVLAAMRDPAVRLAMIASGALLTINWGVFVYAVATARVIQASLGYFLNPLVSIVLGMTVLHERLRRPQIVALGLAAAGVAQLAGGAGGHGIPWISFALAGSFGLYGLVRKQARVEALAGSAVETALMTPAAVAYLIWIALRGPSTFGAARPGEQLLVAASGPITALPLVWFAIAARRLPLTTMGFLQYVGPSLQLGIAVLLFREHFTATHQRAFAFIWCGLAVYSVDTYLAARRRQPRRGR
jgi:chloramphenicol-sensitive protein RarD